MLPSRLPTIARGMPQNCPWTVAMPWIRRHSARRAVRVRDAERKTTTGERQGSSMMRAERLGDVAQLAAAEIEGELQDVVRQNITFWRRRPELSADSADAIQALLARVTEASVQEIDQLIGRLEDMREAVRSEGERLRREVAAFADLNRSALASLKAIAETLPQRTEDKPAHLPDAG